MERVRDLVTEYGESRDSDSNPASLHEFLQRIKVIVNADIDIDMIGEDDNVAVAGGSSSSSSTAKGMGALGNHVVLREIFKCGSPGDLNNFRRFNDQWKGIANSLIIQRRLWKLKFKNMFGGSKSKSNRKRNETLTKLNDCIEASGGSFPLTTLDLSDFRDYSNLNRAALLRFYDLMGHSIKRLVLNNFGPLPLNEFQELLVDKMPNVDHIDAGNIFCTNQELGLPVALPIVLPNLKTIRFMQNKPTKQFQTLNLLPYYSDLLLAAPNLKEILDFRVQLVYLFIETGKMDCIQKLVIDLPVASEVRHYYTKYSTTRPKLTSLSITTSTTDQNQNQNELQLEMCPPALADSVKRILISSKDSLRDLQWVSRIFPADFQLPKFPNLELLTVIDYKHRSRVRSSANSAPAPAPIFPLGCDCSETFPSVTTVSLNTDDVLSMSKSVNIYFQGQVFPSVKTLQFNSRCHFGRALKMIFPNVSQIRSRSVFFTDDQGFDLVNQIESLEFDNVQLAGYLQGFQLDCLFTGAPKDVCSNLLRMYKQHRARGEDPDDQDAVIVNNILEAVRTRHYVFRNSKGLRRVKINFTHKVNADYRYRMTPETSPSSGSGSNNDDDCDLELEREDENYSTTSMQSATVISPVSCVYGFSLMPNLEEVIIAYDHALANASDIAQVFKPLAQFPYVKILHEPSSE